MTKTVNEKFATLGDSMINQMAVGAVKAEYEALGMDTSKLQSNYILRVGGMMLLISLLGGVCTVATGYLAAV
jgi:ATP-binding cassette subfamily B protein